MKNIVIHYAGWLVIDPVDIKFISTNGEGDPSITGLEW